MRNESECTDGIPHGRLVFARLAAKQLKLLAKLIAEDIAQCNGFDENIGDARDDG